MIVLLPVMGLLLSVVWAFRQRHGAPSLKDTLFVAFALTVLLAVGSWFGEIVYRIFRQPKRAELWMYGFFVGSIIWMLGSVAGPPST